MTRPAKYTHVLPCIGGFLVTIAAITIGAAPANATLPEYGGKVVDQNGNGIGGIWVEWKSGPGGSSTDGATPGEVRKYVMTKPDGTFFFRQVFNQTCAECAGKWNPEGDPTDPGYCLRSRIENGECVMYDERGRGYSQMFIENTSIDTDMDGVNDRKYLQAISGATYDLNCHASPHIISVVIPKNRSGLSCTPKDVSPIQNGQRKEVLIECTMTEPTPTIKILKTQSLEIDTDKDGWNSFQCVESSVCSETNPCPGAEAGAAGRRVVVSGIQQLREFEKLPQDEKVYIVECLTDVNDPTSARASERSEYNCTTGIPSADAALGIKNSGGSPRPAGYRMVVYGKDGKTAVANGLTQNVVERENNVFYLETSAPPNKASVILLAYPSRRASSATVGSVGGQQFATLTFAQNCSFHDPYGRAFDAHTLEPLRDVTVTLLGKNSFGFAPLSPRDTGINPRNPQKTLSSGIFEFMVPDGVYRLQASRAGYRLADGSDLHPAARKIYTNLYSGGDIIQKGSPVHTDIPLAPTDARAAESWAKTNPVRVLELEQSQTDDGGIAIEGRTTHPYARLAVYGSGFFARFHPLATAEANNMGAFRIEISPDRLKNGSLPKEIVARKGAVFLGADDPRTMDRVQLK